MPLKSYIIFDGYLRGLAGSKATSPLLDLGWISPETRTKYDPLKPPLNQTAPEDGGPAVRIGTFGHCPYSTTMSHNFHR